MILLTFLGPENLGRKFGVAHDNDLEEAAGREAFAAVVHDRREDHQAVSGDHEFSDDGEKGVEVRSEGV